ncbi:MAG: DUF6519 domain-containing protein [Acidobacteriota bacterium]
MKGDFSRDTFDPRKNFSSVLMQQGRVQLDADWNEQSAILLHYMRTLATDIIGRYGGPDEGFTISLLKDGPNNSTSDLTIAAGRYYVDGIMCENLGNVKGKPFSFLEQPNYRPKKTPFPQVPFLAYLDVWERHVTGSEDADLYEPALGGIDTTTRSQVVWQVRVMKGGRTLAKRDDAEKLVATIGSSSALLSARSEQEPADDDPCNIEPDARYRGAENQLYRVEVHTSSVAEDGTALTPTFKWSRENATVVFPVLRIETGNETTTVTLANLGRDERYTLRDGDWVELVDDDHTFESRADKLLRVTAVDRDESTITLEGGAQIGDKPEKHPLLRRWDQKPKPGTSDDGAVKIEYGTADNGWLKLEDGIQIQFVEKPNGNPASYRTGDYWLIPARVATGKVLWPKDSEGKPAALEPRGILHHYAPLAIIKSAGDPIDCRRKFAPISK